MACLVGRRIVNPHYKKIHPERHYVLYGHKPDYYIDVDCGVCINCVNKYKSTWHFRLQKEFEYMSIDELKKVYYVTLTMAPQWYNEDKRTIGVLIRRFLERVRKHTKKSVKHFLITERGEDPDGEHRIHLHGFFFDCSWSHLIWKFWAYGFVKVKPLYNEAGISGDFIGYCTGYITEFIDNVIVDKFDKPHVFCSKKLGKAYADDPRNIHYHHQNDGLLPFATTYDGRSRSLPRYLRQKIFTDEERKIMKDEYFNNLSDDVIPDPPYYIGTQVYQDYTAYLEACKTIKKQYFDTYGKKFNGSFYANAGAEPPQSELGERF